tara:strand:- start:25921 stop:27120 length:1200 start_codon:yes stop_codon:yes gene_type:complete
MGLIKQTQQQYYGGTKSFTGDGVTNIFTISTTVTQFPTTFSATGVENPNVNVYINGVLYAQSFLDAGGIQTVNYDFNYTVTDGWHVNFLITTPAVGENIKVVVDTSQYQNPATNIVEDVVPYQFTTLKDIINNFIIAYTGEDKIISKANRTDIQFHAMRALQELSFDTFKSTKAQEIEIPPSLKMILPHDYVNYVKLTWKDSAGIEKVIYPSIVSSDPKAIKQNSDGTYDFDINGDGINDTPNLISPDDSDTWQSYNSATVVQNNISSYEDDTYWPLDGSRYGINPQQAQSNGAFYINDTEGYIHFSSNMAGLTVTLKYISDSLGTDEEMQVHKLAEEAMYKHIMYALLSTRMNIPEYVIQRYKKERFAETRKAKLRLSNIKLEEITQILRGKSKFIKH